MPRETSLTAPRAHLVGPGRLTVKNGRLRYKPADQSPLRLDPATLQAVCCYGAVSITGPALAVLLRRRIEVAWFSPSGGCLGRFVRGDESGTAARMRQHALVAQPGRWVLAACNQQRVALADFLTTERGVRLQARALGRVLACWEEHWLESRGDLLLAETLQRFMGGLEGIPGPPTLPDGPETGGL